MFHRIYSRSSFPSNEYKHNSTDFKPTLQPYLNEFPNAHNKVFIEVDIFPEIIFSMKKILSWWEGEGFKHFFLFSNTVRTIAQLTRKGKGCKRFTKMTKIENLAYSTIKEF